MRVGWIVFASVVTVVTVLASGGCKSGPPDDTRKLSEGATADAARHAAATAAAPDAAARKRVVEPVKQDDVRKLLADWLAAQNGGDFAAYSKLYDARFQGVRRSGKKTVKLDRAGWIADRERM